MKEPPKAKCSGLRGSLCAWETATHCTPHPPEPCLGALSEDQEEELAGGGGEKKECTATGIQAVGFPRFQQGKGSDGCVSGCVEPQNADWELDDGVAVCEC